MAILFAPVAHAIICYVSSFGLIVNIDTKQSLVLCELDEVMDSNPGEKQNYIQNAMTNKCGSHYPQP